MTNEWVGGSVLYAMVITVNDTVLCWKVVKSLGLLNVYHKKII